MKKRQLAWALLFCASFAMAGAPPRKNAPQKSAKHSEDSGLKRPVFEPEGHALTAPPADDILAPLLKKLEAETATERRSAERQIKALGEGVRNSELFRAAQENPPLDLKVRLAGIEEALRKSNERISPEELVLCMAEAAKNYDGYETALKIAKVLAQTEHEKPLVKTETKEQVLEFNKQMEAIAANAEKTLTASGCEVSKSPTQGSEIVSKGENLGRKMNVLCLNVKLPDGNKAMACLGDGHMMITPIAEKGFAMTKLKEELNQCFPEKKRPLKDILPETLIAGAMDGMSFTPTLAREYDKDAGKIVLLVKKGKQLIPVTFSGTFNLSQALFQPTPILFPSEASQKKLEDTLTFKVKRETI